MTFFPVSFPADSPTVHKQSGLTIASIRFDSFRILVVLMYYCEWCKPFLLCLSDCLSVGARERCKHFTKAGTTAFDPVSLSSSLSLGECLPSLSARDVCVARTFSLLCQRFCQRCHVRLSFGILISRHLQLIDALYLAYFVLSSYQSIVYFHDAKKKSSISTDRKNRIIPPFHQKFVCASVFFS